MQSANQRLKTEVAGLEGQLHDQAVIIKAGTTKNETLRGEVAGKIYLLYYVSVICMGDTKVKVA